MDTLPQEVSLRALRLYRLRFLSAASLCHAFGPFGGLAPQLSHFGAVLSLAITEHIGIALFYRRVENQKLQERATKRLIGPQFYTEYLAEISFPTMEQA